MLSQLSFACRLGFSAYDGCQTPVASCEDMQEEEEERSGFGSGSVPPVDDWNSALDLHFGSSLTEIPAACHCLHIARVWTHEKQTEGFK